MVWPSAFMEDQPVEVVGQIGEPQFRLGAAKADGADEQAEAVLLVCKDMLNTSTSGGLPRIGARHGL